MKTNILREIKGIGSDVGRSLRGAWRSSKKGWRGSKSMIPFRRGQVEGDRLYWLSHGREASMPVGRAFRTGWKARRMVNPLMGSNFAEGMRLGRGGWQRQGTYIKRIPQADYAEKHVKFIRRGRRSKRNLSVPSSSGLSSGYFVGKYPLVAGTIGVGTVASGGLAAEHYVAKPARRIYRIMKEKDKRRLPTAEEAMMSNNTSEYELLEPFINRSQKTGDLKKIHYAQMMGGVYTSRNSRRRRRRKPSRRRPSLRAGPRRTSVGRRTAGYTISRTRPQDIEENEGIDLRMGRGLVGLSRRIYRDGYGNLKEIITPKKNSPHQQKFRNLTEDFEGSINTTVEQGSGKYKNERPIDPNDDSLDEETRKKLIEERNKKITNEITSKLDKPTQIAATRLLKSISKSKETQSILMALAREGSLPAAIALSVLGTIYIGSRYRRARSSIDRQRDIVSEDVPTTTTGMIHTPRVKYPGRFKNRMAVSPGFGTLRDTEVLPSHPLYLSSRTGSLKKKSGLRPINSDIAPRFIKKNGRLYDHARSEEMKKGIRISLGSGRMMGGKDGIPWKVWNRSGGTAKANHFRARMGDKLRYHLGSARIARRVGNKSGVVEAKRRYRTLNARRNKISRRYPDDSPRLWNKSRRSGDIRKGKIRISPAYYVKWLGRRGKMTEKNREMIRRLKLKYRDIQARKRMNKWGGSLIRTAAKVGRKVFSGSLKHKALRGAAKVRRKAAAIPGFYHGVRGDRGHWKAGKKATSGMFLRNKAVKSLKMRPGSVKHKAYNWGERTGERLRSFDRGFSGAKPDKLDAVRSGSHAAGAKFRTKRGAGIARLGYRAARSLTTDPIGTAYLATAGVGVAGAVGLRRSKRKQMQQNRHYVDQATY